MRRTLGLSLLEVLVTLAVLGVLLGIGASTIRGDSIATIQAARGVAAQVSRARMEALRRNDPVGLRFDAATHTYLMFQDADLDGAFDADERLPGTLVSLTGQGAASVRLTGTSVTLMFDARGILRSPVGGAVISLQGERGATRQVRVTAQGRPEVQ